MLNIKGEVIGINQMIYTQSGVLLALVLQFQSVMLEVINKLRAERKSTWLHRRFCCSDITQEQMKELNLK